jgi:hypothetical protein
MNQGSPTPRFPLCPSPPPVDGYIKDCCVGLLMLMGAFFVIKGAVYQTNFEKASQGLPQDWSWREWIDKASAGEIHASYYEHLCEKLLEINSWWDWFTGGEAEKNHLGDATGFLAKHVSGVTNERDALLLITSLRRWGWAAWWYCILVVVALCIFCVARPIETSRMQMETTNMTSLSYVLARIISNVGKGDLLLILVLGGLGFVTLAGAAFLKFYSRSANRMIAWCVGNVFSEWALIGLKLGLPLMLMGGFMMSGWWVDTSGAACSDSSLPRPFAIVEAANGIIMGLFAAFLVLIIPGSLILNRSSLAVVKFGILEKSMSTLGLDSLKIKEWPFGTFLLRGAVFLLIIGLLGSSMTLIRQFSKTDSESRWDLLLQWSSGIGLGVTVLLCFWAYLSGTFLSAKSGQYSQALVFTVLGLFGAYEAAGFLGKLFFNQEEDPMVSRNNILAQWRQIWVMRFWQVVVCVIPALVCLAAYSCQRFDANWKDLKRWLDGLSLSNN